MVVVLSSSHFVSVTPYSSRSSPAPVWGPAHGRHFSMNFSIVGPSHRLRFLANCSGMSPFHGVQSFRNTLFQRGSPMGSQVLPADVLWLGLLSVWVHRSCQEPAPERAHQEVTASFGHPLVPAWSPPQAADE